MKKEEIYPFNRYRNKFDAWLHVRKIKNQAELADTIAFLRSNDTSYAEISNHLSMPQVRIRHLYRLAKLLSYEVKMLWQQDVIKTGHARVIAGLSRAEQVIVARSVAAGESVLSVRALERARRGSGEADTLPEQAYLKQVESAISSVVGHTLKVKKKSETIRAHRIVIECNDYVGFEAICERLGINLKEIG
jgi:hypothetical protein